MALYADIPHAALVQSSATPTSAVRQLDRVIWFAIAAVACAVALSPLTGHFAIAWRSFAMPAGASAVMLLVAWFYRRYRAEERIASALEGTAQIATFAAVGAPLSYLAASFGLPLYDQLFDAVDKALGFDWAGLLAFMNAHRTIHAILNAAYMSFAPQATIAVCVLAFTGRLIQLRVFVLSFMATALVTIAISAVLPAAGVWNLYQLHADAASILPISHTSWPVFYGLRDGTIFALVASGSEGIITFPSLHAALGLIFALALSPVPFLRWAGFIVNAAMIVATPIDGSHYFVDVIAGLLIAALCWWLARRLAVNIARAG
jgi:membrane-associated phospholipid phosphatase